MEKLRNQIPTIFTFLGILALLAAGGLFLVFGDFNRWVLTSAAIGVIFLVYAILERPETVKRSLTGREAQYGANSAVLTLAMIGIVVAINVFGNRFSYRWDLTENKDFSLSSQTAQILQTIPSPVKATAFFQAGQPGQEELTDLMREYARRTDKFTYEFVDPVLKPGLARDLRVEQYGTTVLEAEGRRQLITGTTEGDLTSALVKLQRGEPRKIGWIVGHGELDIDNAGQGGAAEAKRQLERENYSVQALTLATLTEIPTDITAVVLAGPRTPLLDAELNTLNRYLTRPTAKLFLMLAPRSPGTPIRILSDWGLETADGIVLDYSINLENDPRVPAVVKFPANPIMKITGADSSRYITIFPLATMVRAKKDKDTALIVQTIAESSAERSWLETDANADVRTATLDEAKDIKGPVPMAVSVIKTSPQAPSKEASAREPSQRLVVIGNTTFAANDLIAQVQGNRDLLMNSVNWLAEDETLLGVRSKPTSDRTLMLAGTDQNMLFYTSTLFLPIAVLAVGAFVWWNRR